MAFLSRPFRHELTGQDRKAQRCPVLTTNLTPQVLAGLQETLSNSKEVDMGKLCPIPKTNALRTPPAFRISSQTDDRKLDRNSNSESAVKRIANRQSRFDGGQLDNESARWSQNRRQLRTPDPASDHSLPENTHGQHFARPIGGPGVSMSEMSRRLDLGLQQASETSVHTFK